MRSNTRAFIARALMAVTAVAVGVSALAVANPAAAADKFRFGGTNRYDTAAILSATQFKTCTVVVASGEDFPDGLAGAVFGWPILLTRQDSLPDETVAELDRIADYCGGGLVSILVVGGTAAISPAVFDELASYTAPGNTWRFAGANRYETAIAVAEFLPWVPDDTVILATGQAFADALAAGPVSGSHSYPIILNDGDSVRADVADFLVTEGIETALILGGAAAIPTTVEDQLESEFNITTKRYAGADRAETAVAVAEAFYPNPSCAVIVNGSAFADALAAGPVGETHDCPITLVNQDSVPASTHVWLELEAAAIDEVAAIGGTGVISNTTLNSAVAAATP